MRTTTKHLELASLRWGIAAVVTDDQVTAPRRPVAFGLPPVVVVRRARLTRVSEQVRDISQHRLTTR